MSFLTKISGKIDRKLAQVVSVKTMACKFPKPVVSFTFDDCPRSAVTVGADILEKYGGRGTYYICGGLTNGFENALECQTEDDIRRIIDGGHELASHLFHHRRCEELTEEDLREEIRLSKAYLARWETELDRPHFSYPFGSINLKSKKIVAQEFQTGRGIKAGLNTGNVDLACLKAVALYAQDVSETLIRSWIDKAVMQNAWLIFYTHDVSDQPSDYGITPALLNSAVKYASEQDCALLPVRDAVSN